MTAQELDIAYTEFCQRMTAVGEERASLFLARFALLAMTTIGDLPKVRQMINDAAAIEERVEA